MIPPSAAAVLSPGISPLPGFSFASGHGTDARLAPAEFLRVAAGEILVRDRPD
jgi:hypothetical protein